MNNSEFSEKMRLRTNKLALDIINLTSEFNKSPASRVITYQLIKSATSTGANYRATCRSRSSKAFYSNLSIVIEEVDETMYWLDLAKSANLIQDNKTFQRIRSETLELTRIFSKARSSLNKKRAGSYNKHG